MRSILIISALTTLFLHHVTAQRICGASDKNPVYTNLVMEPGEVSAPLPNLIIIPVVVHVVYHNAGQNISTEQIRSQIAVLNKDFRRKNKDVSNIPLAFKEVAADANIEFRLATVDPSGLPTDGIVRKMTSEAGFGLDDKIKSSSTGGDDAWNRNEYLNLWVGNLSGGVMGYASAPGCAPEKDGVVIRYSNFGATSNLRPPFHKGRTAVHEIGHWLGLRHIWGDSPCGDDMIDDTPPQQGPTRGCPSGTVVTCASGPTGNMYMNFMDFTNDECTNMFTNGQVTKMRSLFSKGGQRAALLESDKATGALSDEELAAAVVTEPGKVQIYPNPAVNLVNVGYSTQEDLTGKMIIIYNHLGQIAKQVVVTKNLMQVNVSDLRPGMYFVATGGTRTYKFIKAN